MKNPSLALVPMSFMILVFGFLMFWSKHSENTISNYKDIEPQKTVVEVEEPVLDPIYKYVDVEKIVDVYHQESPIIATKQEAGSELILLDKSGSMKDFVTSLYKSNVEFFKMTDVWAFDTKVHKDIILDDIEFSGDTDVFQAINMAAEEGYSTIWLCSDLEHNTGKIELSDLAKEIQIIVYSPKILNEEKTSNVIETLKKCTNVKIITIS